MHKHDSPEIKLIPTIKQFCREYYPECVVIFHPTVYFNDDTLKDENWSEEQARIQLSTNKKTKQICEVTPDYGIFRRSDLVGIRLVIGNKDRRELPLVDPDSEQFTLLTAYPDPIPYIAWESFAPTVPKGKVMVVLIKDKSSPVAVIDHKGGRTYNITSQRKKALGQARRFCAKEAYMLTESQLPEPVKSDGQYPVCKVAVYQDCTIWKFMQ